MTGILTPKKIFEYQWLGNIAVCRNCSGVGGRWVSSGQGRCGIK